MLIGMGLKHRIVEALLLVVIAVLAMALVYSPT